MGVRESALDRVTQRLPRSSNIPPIITILSAKNKATRVKSHLKNKKQLCMYLEIRIRVWYTVVFWCFLRQKLCTSICTPGGYVRLCLVLQSILLSLSPICVSFFLSVRVNNNITTLPYFLEYWIENSPHNSNWKGRQKKNPIALFSIIGAKVSSFLCFLCFPRVRICFPFRVYSDLILAPLWFYPNQRTFLYWVVWL